jgi:hypothetical protein
MRYWWVNQNQTYRHEVQGGYLWSPKRNANGARNPFYESMREVAPGDLILSFMDTRILAVGIAQSYCWESPKPLEFGNSGQNWENVGWRVKVRFTELTKKSAPKITSPRSHATSPRPMRRNSATSIRLTRPTSPARLAKRSTLCALIPCTVNATTASPPPWPMASGRNSRQRW